ncbi:MAG: glutamine--fructose-6-phosphate aminotransferase, partial [Enterobacterales bacterium]|nr:glutamine--fructose-6-phosphate aminotransferase [Enterobacterales bacterium]
MCGIVGAVAQRNVSKLLIEGLKRLEYRGYDSAGMAVLSADGQLQRLRRLGKVSELEQAQKEAKLKGFSGIAHTRWATHGQPSEANAHPHMSEHRFAVVHNGIIENYELLREELTQKGYRFESETDTETIVHLINDSMTDDGSIMDAIIAATQRLDGAYAIAVMDRELPGEIFACRKGSPLVIGVGIDEHFIASDQLALLPVTSRFVFLEEDQLAHITETEFTVFDQSGIKIDVDIQESDLTVDAADKGNYQHFMMKEIYEQPIAISETIQGRTHNGKVLDSA